MRSRHLILLGSFALVSGGAFLIARDYAPEWLDLLTTASEPSFMEWNGLVVRTEPGYVLVPRTRAHELAIQSDATEAAGRASTLFFIDVAKAGRDPYQQMLGRCAGVSTCSQTRLSRNPDIDCIVEGVGERLFAACRPTGGPVQFYFVGHVGDWHPLSRLGLKALTGE
jgi:hypothetical protein